MTVYFDTNAFVRRMEAAGMTRGIAEELANVLGSGVLDGLATARDLKEGFERSDNRLRETELALRREIKELELKIALRFGTMLAGAVAILAALITFH